jgi:ABC-type histidine transport system ATPase subunit
MGVPTKLQLEGVTKAYGPKVVLDSIDLTVGEHEVVCLIGSSGCGKSTLLRCIDLLDPIDRGRILLDGEEITGRRVNANAVRRRIGIVFQSFNLFSHLRVIDNVTLGPRRAQGVPRDEADTRALEVLGRLGLADHAREFPERLSGGQQQRVAIARALVSDPEVLLLDEIRRGAVHHPRPGEDRYDHGHRHPRDGLRPRRRRSRVLPRRGAHPRGRSTRPGAASPAAPTRPAVPQARHRGRSADRR